MGQHLYAIIFATLALGFAAGLNGLVAVTLVAVMIRHDGGFEGPLKLNDEAIFGVLVPLTLVEIWLSKIPRIARINDLLQTAWRPVAAVWLAMGAVSIWFRSPWLAVAPCAIALAVQIFRVRYVRPLVRDVTHGIGVPVMSMTEDLVAAVVAILAIKAPQISLAFAILSAYLLFMAYRKLKRRQMGMQERAGFPVVEVAAEPVANGAQKTS